MTQFTASEMRAEAHRHANEVEDMLNAFADLLEAQEKAVPVYQHRSKNGPLRPWFDCSEEIFMAMEHNEHDREHFDRRILYTHPAPADAERLEPPSNLQEALCVIENAALHGVTLHGDDIPRLRATVDRIAPAQQSQDAERLAEALRDARDTVLAFLGDVAADGSRCGMKQAVIKSMFASLLDRFAAHSAQAQPHTVHPEHSCEECGGQNVTWFAPSELWNEVVRSPDGREPMLCPMCFIKHAEKAGHSKDAWSVRPEFYEESAQPPAASATKRERKGHTEWLQGSEKDGGGTTNYVEPVWVWDEPEQTAASVPDAMQELADKYHELLWAVARKFPGETRHETALRYIREAECQEAALAAQENPNA